MKKTAQKPAQTIPINVPAIQYWHATAKIRAGVANNSTKYPIPHCKADEAHQQLLYKLVNCKVENAMTQSALKTARQLPASRVKTAKEPTENHVAGFTPNCSLLTDHICDSQAERTRRHQITVAVTP